MQRMAVCQCHPQDILNVSLPLHNRRVQGISIFTSFLFLSLLLFFFFFPPKDFRVAHTFFLLNDCHDAIKKIIIYIYIFFFKLAMNFLFTLRKYPVRIVEFNAGRLWIVSP